MISLFVLLCVVEIVLLFVLTEKEHGFAATASLVGFVAALQFYFGVDVWAFVQANVTALSASVIAYFMIGVGWSIFKWYWWVGKEADSLKEKKEEHIRGAFWNAKETNQEDKDKFWTKFVKEHIPNPKTEKARILRWMGYWPVSALWFVLNDFVREIFNHLYYRFVAVYQKITDAAINRALK